MQAIVASALLVSAQGLDTHPLHPTVLDDYMRAPSEVGAVETRTAPLDREPVEYSWQDFDRDGKSDVYVRTAGGADRLLQDSGDEFRDVTDAFGLSEIGASLAVTWMDFDADGLPDLHIVTRLGASRLLHNTGASFLDVTETSGAAHAGRVRFHEWTDQNRDGLPDLHLVSDEGDVLLRNLGLRRFAGVALPALPANPGHAVDATRGNAGADTTAIAPESAPDAAAAARARGAAPRSGALGAAYNGAARPIQHLGTCGTPDLDDRGQPGCLQASSVPVLGMLYPLSADLNVSGSGQVGVGTTTPTQKLDVDGTIRSRTGGFEFPDGTSQLTASAGIATSDFAAGPGPDPATTLQFLVTPASVRISPGQKVFVTSHRALGTRAQAGACCLSLWIGRRLVPSGSIVVVGPGMLGNEAVRNSRSTYSCSAIVTDLPAGTYEFGLIGGSPDAVSWDSNGTGYTAAFVFD